MSNDSFIPRYNEDDAAAAFGDFYQGPPHPSNQSGVPITPPPRYPRSREDTVELKRSEYDVLMKIAFTDFPLCLERLKAIDLQLSQIAFNANSGNGRVVMPALRIPSSQQQRTNRPPRLINRIKANAYFEKHIRNNAQKIWDQTKPINDNVLVRGYKTNEQKTKAMIKELRDVDLVDEGADDKTVRKYLYEKFHYLKKNVKLTDEQKQAKRRKGRLDKKIETRRIGLEFVEKNLDTVPVDLKDLVHTAQEDLLVERMQSPELSDVEGELQSLLGDRYNGTGRELYVADVQQRNKEQRRFLHLLSKVYLDDSETNSYKRKKARAREYKLIYISAPETQ